MHVVVCFVRVYVQFLIEIYKPIIVVYSHHIDCEGQTEMKRRDTLLPLLHFLIKKWFVDGTQWDELSHSKGLMHFWGAL